MGIDVSRPADTPKPNNGDASDRALETVANPEGTGDEAAAQDRERLSESPTEDPEIARTDELAPEDAADHSDLELADDADEDDVELEDDADDIDLELEDDADDEDDDVEWDEETDEEDGDLEPESDRDDDRDVGFDAEDDADDESTWATETTSRISQPTRASSRDPELAVRRSRLMRKNRELRQQKARLGVAFIVVGSLLAVALIVSTVYALNSLDREDQLEAALDHARADTKQAEEALEASRREVAALVRNRIPGVRPVEYDTVIAIGEHSVRNLTFTVTRSQRNISYEVRAVVENDTNRTIEPRVDLVLLGPLGLELGRGTIGARDDENSRGAMLPDEVQSFTTTVSLKRGEEPAFFLLKSR
jgi:hypothetical protein